MRRRTIFYHVLLCGAAAFVGCSSGEEWTAGTPPAQEQVWMASAHAMRDSITFSDGETRSIAYGGNNGNRFSILWDTGDKVYVYKGSTYLGYLEPTSTSYGNELGTLTGTLTGSISAGDELKLYLQYMSDMDHNYMDFTGQDGTIGTLSSKSSPQYATTVVSAADIEGGTLTLKDFKLNHVAYYMRYILTDATTGKRLHPSQFELISKNNILARQVNVDGTATPGSLVLNTPLADGEYPGELWVSMYNFQNATDTYTFRAVVDGNIYVGPTKAFSANLHSRAGGMGTLRRSMMCTTSVAIVSISAIADRKFTGYAQEPADMTVTYGTSTLTLGTDYTLEYSDNVNVGEATVTVRGLADAGTSVSTPYIGTQIVHFNILKATPKLQISTADLDLAYGGPSETRAVSRVYIDNNDNDTYEAGIDYDITSLCNISYMSNNTSICTVDSNGLVTPLASGATTIIVEVLPSANWNAVSTYFNANVTTGVRGENTVSGWDDNGTSSGKIYVN